MKLGEGCQRSLKVKASSVVPAYIKNLTKTFFLVLLFKILIEEQLDTTNSLQNEDDIIAKMTSHQEELKSELPWVTEDLEVSEERPGSTLEDVKVCWNINEVKGAVNFIYS